MILSFKSQVNGKLNGRRGCISKPQRPYFSDLAKNDIKIYDFCGLGMS